MFPLHTKTFPATAEKLTKLLNESIGRIFSGVNSPVSIRGNSYPDLRELRILLDGARLRPNTRKPPAGRGTKSSGLTAEKLKVDAAGIWIGPGAVDLRLRARDVRLDQARTKANEIVLVLQSADEGKIEISAAQPDLERVIAEVAKQEAGRQGVTIERVQLDLRPHGPRSVSGEVRLHARKLFFATVIRIAADLDLDDKLNATISGVLCKGDGAIGALACGVLDSHLQKINGRTFSLLAFPLGEIRLRDVRLSVADKITVTAEFGS